jgi:hypothetical protein
MAVKMREVGVGGSSPVDAERLLALLDDEGGHHGEDGEALGADSEAHEHLLLGLIIVLERE